MRSDELQSGRTCFPGRSSRLVSGFTLAELLVVIAIIGLLIAILVPSLSGARTQSKVVATKSLLSSLETALESHKGESRLGSSYPPSASDNNGPTGVPREIADPFRVNPGQRLTRTTGASLLVYGLNGADGLGTPGFLDRNNDGNWSDDFGTVANPPAQFGAHELDLTNGNAKAIRYGPYASTDVLLKSIQSIGKLIEKGSIIAPTPQWFPTLDEGDYKHLVFTDVFSHPILYYRARRAARPIVPLMNQNPPTPGVFDPVDNAAIVGDLGQNGGTLIEGLQFYPGKAHKLANVRRDLGPADDPRVFDPTAGSTYNPLHDETFERYIWDSKVTGRISPVRRDTYLLISAGPDAVYGTADDVTNFGR